MPRHIPNKSIHEIIQDAVRPVVDRASAAVARAVTHLVAEQFRAEQHSATGNRNGKRTAVRSRHLEITRWAADRRARRVPLFVIELTGLDTKKRIVARYGEGATFQRGKPLPKRIKATK